MPPQALFLDVGNTLLREVPSRFEIYARAAVEHGCEIEAESMRALMRKAHRELPLVLDGAFRYSDPWFRAFIERVFGAELGIPAREVRGLTEELFERFEDPEHFRLHDGARELLDRARAAGMTVGVVSNWSARLPRLLHNLGLGEAFDFVFSSALEGLEKPRPELFLRALRRAGVQPSEAVHAGDHPEKDVAAARSVGMEAVLVDHDGKAGETPPEVPRVRSLRELEALILHAR